MKSCVFGGELPPLLAPGQAIISSVTRETGGGGGADLGPPLPGPADVRDERRRWIEEALLLARSLRSQVFDRRPPKSPEQGGREHAAEPVAPPFSPCSLQI
ncbi:hypothetical protein VZT92_010229 [Zoarces viviparus]|uniref:Uncharacterized protein n=1 Tax=Zoarces viviparus TaxID=48416 RepID=A0AAW1FDV2_ZOAVI